MSALIIAHDPSPVNPDPGILNEDAYHWHQFEIGWCAFADGLPVDHCANGYQRNGWFTARSAERTKVLLGAAWNHSEAAVAA
jgi:hypothetical protein